MLELICIKKYLLIKTNTIMLKYIKKAYIMSIANYNETPGGAVEEVHKIEDTNKNGIIIDELYAKVLED